MCQRQNLAIFQLRNSDDLETALSTTKPVALAWDLSDAQTSDWSLVRRLRHYPNPSQAPFILYSQPTDPSTGSGQVGITGFVVKSSNTETLLDALMRISTTPNSFSIVS